VILQWAVGQTRQVLSLFINEPGRNIYSFKRECIENSLYGVDIDPGACEVTKLRLWLSLIVDEEDIRKIKPLPNLDYKIVCGNSLLGVEKDLFNIELIEEIISKITNGHKEFDFEVYFSEVFHQKGGFDVVIANPPYVRIQTIDKRTVGFFKKHYSASTKNYDIYALFDEVGLKLLNRKGFFAYIQPNKFIQADYGIGIRKLLSDEKLVYKIINFGDSQVFENVTTYTCLLFLSRMPRNEIEYYEFKAGNAVDLLEIVQRGNKDPRISMTKIKHDSLKETPWNLGSREEIELRIKLFKSGERLGKISQRIFQGLVTSADSVYILEEREKPRDGFVRVFSKSTQKEYFLEVGLLKPLLKGADISRYFIRKYRYFVIFPYKIRDGKAKLIELEEFRKRYRNIWGYLRENEEKLRNREKGKMNNDKWYAFGRVQNLEQFEQPKILIQVLANKATMTVDLEGKYYFVGGGNAGGYGLTIKKEYNLDLRYIVALLNSNLFDRLLQSISTRFRGGYYSYAKRFIEQLPIKIANKEIQNKLVSLVNKILSLTQSEDYLENPQRQAKFKEYEHQIDQLIYKLYDLTDKEIKIVEDFMRNKL